MKSLQKHLKDIRLGGISVALRKISFILTMPVVIPAVILVRFIRPWIHVRFGWFLPTRIGHFATDVGLALAENELNNKDAYSDWYFLPQKSCNQQWVKMTRRNFRVRGWVSFFYSWNVKIPGGKAHIKKPALSTQGSRDIHGWLSKLPAKMTFLPDEENIAKSWLKKQGWKDDEPFVCLLVRDSGYLINSSLHNGTEESTYYHNYRCSDISTYVRAVEFLAEQGIWVLRMGKEMKKPISISHPKVIDYAFHPAKSDLLDVWLFANCYFCISTGSGPDAISDVYQRPLLMVNFSPLSNIVSWSDCVTVPKNLMWEKTNEPLKLLEYLNNNYVHTQQYEQAGITLKDLTSQEIKEAVEERLERLKGGSWIDKKEDIDLQNRFWDQFKAWPGFSKYHNWIHPEARIGAHFLRKMGAAFYD